LTELFGPPGPLSNRSNEYYFLFRVQRTASRSAGMLIVYLHLSVLKFPTSVITLSVSLNVYRMLKWDVFYTKRFWIMGFFR